MAAQGAAERLHERWQFGSVCGMGGRMMNENICPCCERPVIVKRYYDEVWGRKYLTETVVKCECGYSYCDSYGQVFEEYPAGEGE